MLTRNADETSAAPARIAGHAVPRPETQTQLSTAGIRLTNPQEAERPEAKVVELMGLGTASTLPVPSRTANMVTANKAMIAHGNEIFAAAQKKGAMVAFEAAVAAALIIRLSAKVCRYRIEWLAGIINAPAHTTEMRDRGMDFADVLPTHSASQRRPTSTWKASTPRTS
jgi:homoserine dehydrogenase